MLTQYQVDAFASQPFSGNPAAIVPLREWLPDEVMQALADENNLAETAYFVPADGDYRIRWFTPRHEVELCGHATLASANIVFTVLEPGRERVVFHSLSGPLPVTRHGARIELDFPALARSRLEAPPQVLLDGLGIAPLEVFVVGRQANYLAVLADEQAVRGLKPDLSALERLHPAGVIVTAPGIEYDCVSRYFAPSYGIPEDPVTGSAHCALVPYWAERVDRTAIRAFQASRRGGELFCTAAGRHARSAVEIELIVEIAG